jgi:hypothetical protein
MVGKQTSILPACSGPFTLRPDYTADVHLRCPVRANPILIECEQNKPAQETIAVLLLTFLTVLTRKRCCNDSILVLGEYCPREVASSESSTWWRRWIALTLK